MRLVEFVWRIQMINEGGLICRTPVWHQSYLNDSLAGTMLGPARRFESIYRHCQFTPARPGYVFFLSIEAKDYPNWLINGFFYGELIKPWLKFVMLLQICVRGLAAAISVLVDKTHGASSYRQKQRVVLSGMSTSGFFASYIEGEFSFMQGLKT